MPEHSDGLLYFPGCSLKAEANDFESSAMAVMESLGLPLQELERWNCCGTVYSLTQDDLMHQLAPIRNLIRAQECGSEELVILCSMCFNTLKRADGFIEDPERRNTINQFMDDEVDYAGHVQVLHLLEVLRDRIGWAELAEKVTKPLQGWKIAPYYGCTLLRPHGIGIDEPDVPSILYELLEALLADPIDFPFQTECCGSYQIVDRPELSTDMSGRILGSAQRAGADLIVASCPLCVFNLRFAQDRLVNIIPRLHPIPVLYFTQLIAMSMGLDPGDVPKKLLEELRSERQPV